MKIKDSDNGRVTEATLRQMLDYFLVLTNTRGDELWRWFDGDDNKPRWKVWAVEPEDRSRIKKWGDTMIGANYSDTGIVSGHQRYVGTDFIIPRKYLVRVSKVLGLRLGKEKPKPLTKEQQGILKQRLEKARSIKANGKVETVS